RGLRIGLVTLSRTLIQPLLHSAQTQRILIAAFWPSQTSGVFMSGPRQIRISVSVAPLGWRTDSWSQIGHASSLELAWLEQNKHCRIELSGIPVLKLGQLFSL